MIHASADFARDAPAWTPIARRPPRRFWSRLVLFAALVLLVNGLFGERGLLQGRRARRTYATAAEEITRLRQANEDLRAQARRLRSDPATIEAVARGELGLVRPGEILVTVRDLLPASR